jgi:hypothetical protein
VDARRLASAHRGDEGELVVLRQLGVGRRIAAVDGHPDRESGEELVEAALGSQGFEGIGHGGSLGERQIDRFAPRSLAQDGEEANTNAHGGNARGLVGLSMRARDARGAAGSRPPGFAST